MTHKSEEASASWLSELLLYHAALGRGYRAPFAPARGLVFSSALPEQALTALWDAEARIRDKYAEQQQGLKRELEQLKERPKEQLAVTGDRSRVRELQEQVNRNCYVTRTEEAASKSTILDLLQKSHYGAMTYVDPGGARLAVALSSSMRLASDLGWYNLTERSSEEALLRSSSDNGTLMLSLLGRDARFGYFCRCNFQLLAHLEDRIKNSVSGHAGIGHTVTIQGESDVYSGVTSAMLESLMQNVYIRGDLDEEKRIQVRFEPNLLGEWGTFLRWGLRDIIGDDKEMSEWQRDLARKAPCSPGNAILFATRAAMTWAFIDATKSNPHGRFPGVIELGSKYLKAAQEFARMLYLRSSGHDEYAIKLRNIAPRTGRDNYLTTAKLQAARVALEKAIAESPDGKVSRNQTRYIEGVSLAMLDELVRKGDVVELVGVEQCRMGKTTRAYILPSIHQRVDEQEAAHEFAEASERYTESPQSISLEDATVIYGQLQQRAEEFNNEHALPVVPLSCMTREQRRVLPKIIEIFSDRVLMRAKEPDALLGEDSPLDALGLNLWMRDQPRGGQFRRNWRLSGKLQLTHFCGDEQLNEQGHEHGNE